jgi:hypothetical protein
MSTGFSTVGSLEDALWQTLESGGRPWNEREHGLLHEFAMKVARASEVNYLHGIRGYDKARCERDAALRYPLPPKRVLREELDPNGGEVLWRHGEDGLAYKRVHEIRDVWASLTGGIDHGRVFTPYPERIRLWADLLANPYREEAQ